VEGLDLFSPIHLVIILAVALLIFGPRRLPEIGTGLGKTIRSFRSAMNGEEEAGLPPAPPKDGPDREEKSSQAQ